MIVAFKIQYRDEYGKLWSKGWGDTSGPLPIPEQFTPGLIMETANERYPNWENIQVFLEGRHLRDAKAGFLAYHVEESERKPDGTWTRGVNFDTNW